MNCLCFLWLIPLSLIRFLKPFIIQIEGMKWLSRISGMKWWNETLEWNTGIG